MCREADEEANKERAEHPEPGDATARFRLHGRRWGLVLWVLVLWWILRWLRVRWLWWLVLTHSYALSFK